MSTPLTSCTNLLTLMADIRQYKLMFFMKCIKTKTKETFNHICIHIIPIKTKSLLNYYFCTTKL